MNSELRFHRCMNSIYHQIIFGFIAGVPQFQMVTHVRSHAACSEYMVIHLILI